jgi:hypothetical protein
MCPPLQRALTVVRPYSDYRAACGHRFWRVRRALRRSKHRLEACATNIFRVLRVGCRPMSNCSEKFKFQS